MIELSRLNLMAALDVAILAAPKALFGTYEDDNYVGIRYDVDGNRGKYTLRNTKPRLREFKKQAHAAFAPSRKEPIYVRHQKPKSNPQAVIWQWLKTCDEPIRKLWKYPVYTELVYYWVYDKTLLFRNIANMSALRNVPLFFVETDGVIKPLLIVGTFEQCGIRVYVTRESNKYGVVESSTGARVEPQKTLNKATRLGMTTNWMLRIKDASPVCQKRLATAWFKKQGVDWFEYDMWKSNWNIKEEKV